MNIRQALVSDIPAISLVRLNVLQSKIADCARTSSVINQNYLGDYGRQQDYRSWLSITQNIAAFFKLR